MRHLKKQGVEGRGRDCHQMAQQNMNTHPKNQQVKAEFVVNTSGHKEYCNDESACSTNLFPQWQRCCESIMNPFQAQLVLAGAIDDHCFPEVVNLLPDENCDEVLPYDLTSTDSWLLTAYTLREAINSISTLLQERGHDYADLDFVSDVAHCDEKHTAIMTEAEKSHMEASILSFTMQTVNQIEMMRQKLLVGMSNNHSDDMVNHKSGILAILLQSLRQQVAMPMEALQKLRRREANLLRQNPLSCHAEVFVDNDDGDDDALFYDDKPRSFRYARSKTSDTLAMALESCIADGRSIEEAEEARIFWSAYDDSQDEVIRSFHPIVKNVALEDEAFRAFHDDDSNGVEQESASLITIGATSAAYVPNDPVQPPSEMMDQELQQQLYQEHVLLVDTFERSALDEVGKMENTMVDITRLLNQFSHLISEQQEDVQLLHEQTKTAKTYVESGQDKLLDASERGKKSQHRMATFIVLLALLLLLFNWITP